MSTTHAKRAKVWQTNEFNAEWLQNAVTYCRKDPNGRRDFEASWTGRNIWRNGCQANTAPLLAPPPRIMTGTPPKDGIWLAQAAFDLGVTEEALTKYAEYVNGYDLAAPPRTKPAIKRKRGEGSIEWLSRRHEAHLAGHKVPEMDWPTARAIAVSEFDRVRDTWELWHTSPQTFFDELYRRGITIILSPQILANPDKDWVRWHKFDDALRHRVYSLTLAHMVWFHASTLLEDLFAMGLTASSQIAREYKRDRRLMMRLIACYTKMGGLALHLWSNMVQVVSASPNLLPCVVRRLLTFEVFGELAVVYEFLAQMEQSTFGKALMQCSRALKHTDEALWAEMCSMKPPKAWATPRCLSPWGEPYITVLAVRDIWRTIAWRLNMQGTRGPMSMPARIERGDYLTPIPFDDFWRAYDEDMWINSEAEAQSGCHHLFVRHFGLYDVRDNARPTAQGAILREILQRVYDFKVKTRAQKEAEAKKQAPAPVILEASKSAAQSGHAFLAQAETPKQKLKTRKSEVAEAPTAPENDTQGEADELPDFLPEGYKLGKKVVKVFHRILEDDKSDASDNTSEIKTGQIRWEVFERAMKRIGFSVCQTAGSSVRFDPPAKNARPITFHRPHPDSLLTPLMIKWIGARLKRNYGWTAAIFTQGIDAK
ncbi:hypothetical protein C8R45DRAFT_1103860 [Mycena sanguinolenta]|nr:hypothetical protein C8R45DRAFT_1103860 [Mycena sanguinolenta]